MHERIRNPPAGKEGEQLWAISSSKYNTSPRLRIPSELCLRNSQSQGPETWSTPPDHPFVWEEKRFLAYMLQLHERQENVQNYLAWLTSQLQPYTGKTQELNMHNCSPRMLIVLADLNIAYASKVKIVIPWTREKERLNQNQEVTAQSPITVGMDSNSAVLYTCMKLLCSE